ncbi:hypothetical protein Q9290_05525 [Oceanimonas sp. CHS3-5]|nr:hypothetical protein [Oceanimonas sp. CHS3-5]MDP5291747.1 hypothetical protein [Oceanimonas sp. CHS3-5]
MNWLNHVFNYAGLVALGLLILWAVARLDDWLAAREKSPSKH